MVNNLNYYNPVRIVFGRGNVVSELQKRIGDKRILLITSQGFTRRRIIEQIETAFEKKIKIIDSIPPNPTINYLLNLYSEIVHTSFDCILALGGGSVIDSAKVLSVFSDEGLSKETIRKLIIDGEEIQYKLLPIIAIPTTAGTSSELTPWATVWDPDNQKKHSLHLPNLWCNTAIYDPLLTLTLPTHITLQTGLDALSHSMESIWNKNANPISTEHALYAINEIQNTLPVLIENEDDVNLRERMMYASLKAGLAFSNTQTAVAHAISYELTLQKNITHGIACSITLPSIISTFFKQESGYVKKDILAGIDLNKVVSFFNKINISINLSDYGISLSDLERIKKSLLNIPRAQNSIVNVDLLFEELANQY